MTKMQVTIPTHNNFEKSFYECYGDVTTLLDKLDNLAKQADSKIDSLLEWELEHTNDISTVSQVIDILCKVADIKLTIQNMITYFEYEYSHVYRDYVLNIDGKIETELRK